MKRIFRIFITIIAIAITAFIVLVIKETSMFSFSISDRKLNRTLLDEGLSFSIDRLKSGSQTIRYVKVRGNKKRTIVIIHGAPGSLKDFKRYFTDKELLEEASIIAVDRPGYGGSDYGRTEPSVINQAIAIGEVLKEIDSEKVILAGHSYGGPVASAVTMLNPSKVDALMLKAPAIDPANEKKFWIAKLGAMGPIKQIISGALGVASEEKLAHVDALKEMLPMWEKINIPVTMIHGKKDKIVPVENIEFLKRMIPNQHLRVVTNDDMNHIMIWTDYELVKKEILHLINRID